MAARLTGMHPQTLRKYERVGFVRPARQSGNQRLYSDNDIDRLNRIRFLVEDRGLNLAGLRMTLSIVDRLERVEGHATSGEMREAIDDAIRASSSDAGTGTAGPTEDPR